MVEMKTRTLIAEAIVGGQRKFPGEIVILGPRDFARFAGAKVIEESDERDAEVAAEWEKKRKASAPAAASGAPAGEASNQADDLDGRTVADLKDVAAAEGVTLEGSPKKADIIAAIRAKRGEAAQA